MVSVVNARCKRFTSDSCPLPTRSWRSLVVITSPRVPRSLAFWLPSVKRRWSCCGAFFKKISSSACPPFTSPGGLSDRLGNHWLVVDVDATRQAARQRALPQLKSLPAAHRRLNRVCRPAYLGRKRGRVGRSRTTVLEAPTHQGIGP